MTTLVGVTFDLYCKRCRKDATATVRDDLGSTVLAELDCCSREVEAFAVDLDEMLADCGV